MKKSFEKSLFTPLIVGNALVFLVFAIISYAIIEKSFSKSIKEQVSTSASIFTDSIREDLVMGLEREVYKKCKSFAMNKNVKSIKVSTPANDRVCSISNKDPRSDLSITRSVYFDEEEDSSAAQVTINFANNINQRFIISSMTVLALSFLVLIFLLSKAGRIFIRQKFKPISELATALSTKNTSVLKDISKNLPKDPEIELEQLYKGVEKHAFMVEKYQGELVESAKAKTINEIYAGLVHDLKSPLTGITMIAHDEKHDPVTREMLLRSVDKVYAQIDELLSLDCDLEGNFQEKSVIDAASTLKRNIEIKKYALESSGKCKINYKKVGKGPFDIAVSTLFFTRAMSNLVQNAIEATEKSGRPPVIDIIIKRSDKNIVIKVKDNGIGIKEKNISSLGRKGVTYNKENGTGLGLYQVNKMLELHDGQMDISSIEGVGTEIKVTIPAFTKVDPIFNLIIENQDQVITILDDDDLVHSTWKEIFRRDKIKNSIKYFNSPKKFEDWAKDNQDLVNSGIALFDYDLKSSQSGLDVLSKYTLKNTNMVTGESSNSSVIKRCQELNINLIPKERMAEIKFSSQKYNSAPEQAPSA